MTKPLPRPLPAEVEPVQEVWLAMGLHKRWRVCSIGRTFGEWDQLADAQVFLSLLVDGNANLRRIW